MYNNKDDFLARFHSIGVQGRQIYVFSCFENILDYYNIKKENFQLPLEILWSYTDYCSKDDWTEYTVMLIPEVAFDEQLDGDEYDYLLDLKYKLIEVYNSLNFSEDLKKTFDDIITIIRHVTMIHLDSTIIPPGRGSLSILEDIWDFMEQRNIPFPDAKPYEIYKLSEDQGWGIPFNARDFSRMLPNEKKRLNKLEFETAGFYQRIIYSLRSVEITIHFLEDIIAEKQWGIILEDLYTFSSHEGVDFLKWKNEIASDYHPEKYIANYDDTNFQNISEYKYDFIKDLYKSSEKIKNQLLLFFKLLDAIEKDLEEGNTKKGEHSLDIIGEIIDYCYSIDIPLLGVGTTKHYDNTFTTDTNYGFGYKINARMSAIYLQKLMYWDINDDRESVKKYFESLGYKMVMVDFEQMKKTALENNIDTY